MSDSRSPGLAERQRDAPATPVTGGSDTIAETGPKAEAASRPVLGRLKGVGLTLIPIVIVIGLWQAATTWWLSPARIYPPPADVFGALLEIVRGEAAVGSAYAHLLATAYRIAVAFVVSFVVGAVLGVAAGRYKVVFDLLSNLLWIFMAIPSIVWAFIFVVIVGTGDVVPIAALVALLTPKVIITVAEGTKAAPADLYEMTVSYGFGVWRRVVDFYIPYLVPYLVSSARVSFSVAIKLAVVAETIGLTAGIGYELNNWYNLVEIAPIAAWGVVMIVMGIAVDYWVFGPLERRMSAWRTAETGGLEMQVAE